MLTNIRSFFYRFKSLQAPLEKWFFPVILLLYPQIGAAQGLDIADTTYSLANYQFLDKLDTMWALSTYISNITGELIMKLPGAYTMLGMNLYTRLIISVIALVCYFVLQKWMPGWMIFIGEFIAESLCWCPSVILYNYLTYLFMSLGVLLLFIGMFKREKGYLFLVLAGVCLGMNVMVRFPNIVEGAFIVVLWFYLARHDSTFFDSLKKTMLCILGYVTGLIIPAVSVSIHYGIGAYFDMISSLFGMTEGASDYTMAGMLVSVATTYMQTLGKMLLFVGCAVFGFILFRVFKGKYVSAKKLIYIGVLLVAVRFYFAKGIFTRNYYYYDSVFQAAMMFVIISFVLCAVSAIGLLGGSIEERTISLGALAIILITPLGSNNYTYPVINNLFIVAPVSLWLFRRLMQHLGDKEENFSWQAVITVVISVLLVQGPLFHAGFAFGDGDDGRKRNANSNIPKVNSMVTTAENAHDIDDLHEALRRMELHDNKVVLFGGVPGLSYIFDMEPALDTTWPDLDSYSVSKFHEQLKAATANENGSPVVIVGNHMADYSNIKKKYDILMDYMDIHDYNKVFENERFTVYYGGIEREGN